MVSILRNSDCSGEDIPTILAAAGYTDEAMALSTPDLVSLAEKLLTNRHVMPTLPLIGIVGSRQVSSDVRDFAEGIGHEAVHLGFSVVSGGAIGCDRAGASGALKAKGAVLELLPNGLNHYEESDRCALSVCAPDETFSTAAARRWAREWRMFSIG